MRALTTLFGLLAAISLSVANPVPEPEAEPEPEPEPVPVAEAAPAPEPKPYDPNQFAGQAFDVNVLMVAAGGTQYGVFVPTDGILRTASSLTCLNIRTGQYGGCNLPVVDQVGVRNGYGPCSFIGNFGWIGTQEGTATSGFLTVGPPQNLVYIYCAP